MSQSFAAFFTQSPELSAIPDDTKIAVINRAYEKVQSSGAATSEQLRNFRDAELRTLYDLDQASGQSPQGESYQDWQNLHRGIMNLDEVTAGLTGMSMPARREISPERQALFDEIDKRNFKATLSDVGRVAADFSHYPKAIAKTATDLFGIAAAGSEALNTIGANILTDNPEGVFAGVGKSFSKEVGSEKVNKWYEESIKDDPSMYKMFDSALVDATMGSIFGIARAKKAVSLVQAAGEVGLQTAASPTMTAARNFMAPVVSNVLGGQVVYHGLEAVNEQLKDAPMSDSAKNGIRVGAILVGSLASGLTLERYVEQVVAGNPLRLKAAENIGNAVQEAQATGKPFQQIVAENQNISEDMKTILGVRSEDGQVASNFDVNAAAAQVDLLNSAQNKVRAGEELTAEEAAALQKAGRPTIGTDAFSEQELAQITASVAPKAETQLADFEGVDSFLRQPAEVTKPLETAKVPARSTEDFPPVDSFLSRTDQVEAPTVSTLEEPVSKTRDIPLLDVSAKESSKQHILPYSRATFTQRGLATLDSLNQQAIALRAQSNAARTAGNVQAAEALEQQITGLVDQLKETEKAMALTLTDTKSLKAAMVSEMKDVEKQMKSLQKRASSASEEEKAALREEYSALAERAKLLKKNWDVVNTSQVILKRSGKDLEVRPVTPEPSKDLIARIRAREKSQTDALSLATAATAEKAKKGKLYEFSPKPGGQDLQGIDPMSRLGELPPQAQLRVRQMTQALKNGYEALIGRPLDEVGTLAIMERVLDDTATTSGRMFEDTPHALAQVADSTGVVQIGVNAGFVESRYPKAFQLLKVLNPEALSSSVFSPDAVLASMQGLVSRSGFGMAQESYELSREVMKEVFDLWDEVKGSIPVAEGADLKSFLKENSTKMNLSKRQANAVADAISEAFPDLKVAFKYDRAAAGLGGMCDALTRLITVGADGDGLRALTHELGHYHFYYGMDSGGKLSWLDSMRRSTDSDTAWAASFPGYNSRAANLGALSPEQAAKELFWMHNPAEMYAEQFSAYALTSIIPQADTLASFAKVQNGLKKVLRVSNQAFEQMPPETQQFILKTLTAPDVTELRKLDDAKVQELLESSWYYTDRDTALQTVAETAAELEATYAGRTTGLEGMPAEALDRAALQAQDAVTDVVAPGFFSLPAEQRVMMYATGDLPKVAELQALRLLYDLPGADMKELDLVFKRLNTELSDAARPELIERMVQARMPLASKYDPNYDPSTMSSRPLGELRDIESQERTLSWNRLDPEARAAVDADNMAKARQRYALMYGAIKDKLAELKSAGQNISLTKEEMSQVVSRFLSNKVPVSRIENELQESIREALYDTTPQWDSARSAVMQELAAMDTNVEALRQFASAVMAKRGLIDIGDGSFQQRLSAADQFSALPRNVDSYSAAQVLSVLARAGFVGGAGLEYDPDGVYVPFLGTVTFNPAKLADNPLVLAVAPGVPTVGAKLARIGMKRVGRPAYEKLPYEMRRKIGRATKAVVENFGPHGGYSPELVDMISRSKSAGARTRKNWYELASLINSRFSPKEREQIAILATKDEGWQDIAAATADNPDIQAAVNIVKANSLYIEDTFKKVGVESEHFKDVGENYLTRYYRRITTKPLNAIFKASNISPIRANFLKRRGVVETLRDVTRGPYSNKAFSVFLDNVRSENIQLIDGMRINGYKTAADEKVYAVAGSAFDKQCSQQYLPWHVWDDKAGVRGFIIDGQSSKSINLRRDFSKAERDAMGEVVDVSVRLAAMGERMSKDFQKAHLYNSLAHSDFVIDASKGSVTLPNGATVASDVARQWALDNGYRLVPNELDTETGIMVYGALSGKYIKDEAWEAVMSSEPSLFRKWLNSEAGKASTLGTALATYSAGLRSWKIAKTALSPVAHMNNFVSNAIMGFILGRNPMADLKEGLQLCHLRNLDIRYKKLYKEGKIAEAQPVIQEMQAHPYYNRYQEIRDANMSDSSEWANEISAESLAEQLASAETSGASGGITGTLKNILGTVGDAARWAQLKYEGGDLIYKMGAFSVARREGKDVSTALREAYEAYFDYSQLAPGIKFLRDSGLVPFVSYMYKAVPALVKAIHTHPGRVAVAGLALEGLNMAGLSSLYGDTELIRTKEAVDEATPSYMQGRGLGGLFRTRIAMPFSGGMRSTEGGQQIPALNMLDMSRMIPGGDLWETNSAGLNNIEFSMMGAGKMLGSMLMQSPIISSAVMAVAQGNPILGTSFNNGGDLDSPAVKERIRSEFLKSFWNTMVPNLPFIPYTYSQDNFMQGLVNAGVLDSWKGETSKDFSGLPKSFTTAMAGQVGIKVRPIAPESMMQRKISADEFQLNREKGRLRKLLKDRSYTSEYKQEAREEFVQTAKHVTEKTQRRGQLIQRLRDARQRAQDGKSLVR